MPEETKPQDVTALIAAVAPTLVEAGIDEQSIQADLRSYEKDEEPAVAKPDPQTVKALYGWLKSGATVESAARMCCCDVVLAQRIADEVAAAKTECAKLAPVKKGSVEAVIAGEEG